MTAILQWNCRGYSSNYEEIISLIRKYQPKVILLQETMLGVLTPRAPSGYSIITSSQTGRAVPGDGLAILIRNGIPSKPCNLTTNIPAIAIQVRLDQLYTICNVYLPHHQDISSQEVENLFNQLSEPTIIAGDFNAKHTLWGNVMNDRRGHLIENIITQSTLTLLNTGSPTHFHVQSGSYSAIDLSICSASVPITMEWMVEDGLFGSDHYPIIMNEIRPNQVQREPRLKLDKADWPQYYKETIIDPFNEIMKIPSIDMLIEFYNDHITSAAISTIPKSTGRPQPHRVPWWNIDCTTANYERKRALRRYQRTGAVVDKISYNRARARAKYIKKKARKESWQNYVSTINIKTPMSKIWSRMRKMRGIYKSIQNPILKDQNEMKSDPTQVAEILANHYENVSSSQRYCDKFRRIQIQQENNEHNFKTKANHSYNIQFNYNELASALKNSKESAPGNDQIPYKLIDKSHKTSKMFLLSIFNRIWISEEFPSSWRMGLVLSFLKQGKPPEDPRSYRPITLTSCVGKLLEKMVNTRLMMVLEAHNMIPREQFGFRKMKSTIEPLVKTTSDILSAFKQKKNVLCVSFDIEKAYDTTWKHGILQALHDNNLRGHLPIYIRNFLTDRKFQTIIGSARSEDHTQEQGVPQGSVISCTLFSLAINGILSVVPHAINAHLYVDDLIMYTTGTYLSGLERRMQAAINKVNKWAEDHGFRFSTSKTVSIYFNRKRNIQPPPQLFLNNNPIPSKSHIKYLGMLLDEKLDWKEHIRQLKVNCTQRLDILKVLSHTTWGADRTILLRLYRSIIRSKLDYGSMIYSSAKPNILSTLDPVHNAAIRLCTGAYRSSPVISLYADAGEPPLNHRRQQLLLQFYARSQQMTSSIIYDYVQPLTNVEIVNIPNHSNPIHMEITKALNGINISKFPVIPFKFGQDARWTLGEEVLCDGYECPAKRTLRPTQLKHLFTQHCLEEHENAKQIYTDGSKNRGLVGSAAVNGDTAITRKLPPSASIFSAELTGIIDGLRMAEQSTENNFVIYVDSKSAIQITTHFYSCHPLISRITRLLVKLKLDHKKVVFCWCPSHVGVTGNELADREANDAANNGPVTSNLPLPCRDYYPVIKESLREKWRDEWHQVGGNKLRRIKEDTLPLPSSNIQNRYHSRILTRLRIGHCTFSHQHLMEKRPIPECPYCLSVPISVRHVLSECQMTANARERHFPQTRLMNNPDSIMKTLLIDGQNESFNIAPLVEFIKELDLYFKI